MNERYGLAIAVKQIACGDVNERDPGRVVLDLNWNGGYVLGAA
jgi:hypothetical protein